MSGTFEDGKDDGALRTIGEVGKALGLKPHVLRYWEEQFPMLEPLKRSGNRRYYRPGDVALIETINRLVNVEGYTLKGARTAIEDGRAAVEAASDAPVSEAPVLPQDAPPDGGDGAASEAAPETGPDMGTVPGAGAPERAPRSAAASVEARGVPSELIAELKEIRARLQAAIAE